MPLDMEGAYYTYWRAGGKGFLAIFTIIFDRGEKEKKTGHKLMNSRLLSENFTTSGVVNPIAQQYKKYHSIKQCFANICP